MDIKTGSDFNKLGHAMQLAMYARMVPYIFPGDQRGVDPDEVDLNIGYIIKLPEGQGRCEVVPMDIEMGWRACQLAKLVWETRDWNPEVERDIFGEATEMAARAGSLKECRTLWATAKQMGTLDNRMKTVLRQRAEELEGRGITA